jgi:hypothetical protein
MKFDNIIPLGDHCAGAFILKDLNLRIKAYPFDWTNHSGGISKTSIYKNIFLLRRLLRYGNPEKCAEFYIGNALEYGNHKTNHGIQFPHESENAQITNEKYKRRFSRLYNDIISGCKNLYIIITRKIYIDQDFINDLEHLLLFHNSESKILFISGNENTIATSTDKFILKYIKYEYNPEIHSANWYQYDKEFHQEIKIFLSDFLQESFY